MADLSGNVAESVLDVIAVEQRGGLLEREVLRLNDEDVEEDELEGDPATVDDL